MLYQLQLRLAVYYLQRGDLVGYPTEAVFGLGCCPDARKGIAKLLALKQRDPRKGLILIAAHWQQLLPWLKPLSVANVNKLTSSRAHAVTWLLPAKSNVDPLLRGKHVTLAVRVSTHPVVQNLCLMLKGPIISTSANVSGQPALRTASRVRYQFHNRLNYVLDAPVGGALRPSEIRDLSGRIFRPG